MKRDVEENELKQLFRELRREDESLAPPFDKDWDAALSRMGGGRSAGRRAVSAGITLARPSHDPGLLAPRFRDAVLASIAECHSHGLDAFLYEAGRLRLIDEGGPAFTAATAINDRGEVAGVLEKDDEPGPAKPAPIKEAW